MEYRIRVDHLRDGTKHYVPQYYHRRWWHLVEPEWRGFVDSVYGEAYDVKFLTLEEAKAFIENESTIEERAYHARKMKEVRWTEILQYPFEEISLLSKRREATVTK